LDWTENILVAIYFAVEDDYLVDRRIYIYDTDRIAKIEKVFSDEIEYISKFYPPIIHKRIISQSSLFLVCNSPYLDIRERKDGKLDEVIIPQDAIKNIRFELSRLGVDSKSIWPDFTSIVKYIQWFMSERYIYNDIRSSYV